MPAPSSIFKSFNMPRRATITFSTDAEGPVFVVTELSTPPWTPLEMSSDNAESPGGHRNFTRSFEGIAEGEYQYKVRIGEDHWVVDEAKETGNNFPSPPHEQSKFVCIGFMRPLCRLALCCIH